MIERGHTHRVNGHSEIALNKAQRPQQCKYDVLVLDAILRQSLVTVRSLGSRGLRVAAMETFNGIPTFWSRWCQRAFVCPTDGRAETYVAALTGKIPYLPSEQRSILPIISCNFL